MIFLSNMSKINCNCGHLIDSSKIPNDIEYWIFSDKEWQENQLKAENCESLNDSNIESYKCPKCNRFYFFRNKQIKPYAVYKLEFYDLDMDKIGDV